VSAQVITALRARAEHLRREAEYWRRKGNPPHPEMGWNREPALLALIADELAALADEAESREPQDGEIEP
jgi:hypothetical protein